MSEDPKVQSLSRRWYNLFAPLYDPTVNHLEGAAFNEWRKLLWSKVEGRTILEVGVGTGRCFPFYPEVGKIVAVDFSEKMLDIARQKAVKDNIRVDLALMDTQALGLQDNTFDTVVSSLVFCGVPDPLEGLKEVKRVVRSGRKVVMLEHVLSDRVALAQWMNVLNWPIANLTGENINRRTEDLVKESGFNIESVTRLSSIFRLIEARKPQIYLLK